MASRHLRVRIPVVTFTDKSGKPTWFAGPVAREDIKNEKAKALIVEEMLHEHATKVGDFMHAGPGEPRVSWIVAQVPMPVRDICKGRATNG